MKQIANVRQKTKIARFFKWLGKKIAHLFEPEEVEVTFTRVGNKIHYSYRKTDHKQIA